MAYSYYDDHRFSSLKDLNEKKTVPLADGENFPLYKPNPDKYSGNSPLTTIDDAYKATDNDYDKKKWGGPHHYDTYINPGKFIDFWLGNPKRIFGDNKEKFNWRRYKPSGWTHGINVNTGVVLVPSSPKFKSTINIALKQFNETLQKGTGILDLIAGVTSTFTKSTYISEFGAPQLFENIEPITFETLTFEFKFGQAGLFSGLEEVVKPIYALAMIFTPNTKSEFPKINGLIENPFPTKLEFFFQKLSEMKAKLGDLALSDMSATPIQKLSELNYDLQSMISSGNMSVATSHRYKNIWLTYGPFTFGPCQCKGVSYEFDMNHLDEFGYPIAGRLTLNGLQTSRKGTSNAVLSQIVKDNL